MIREYLSTVPLPVNTADQTITEIMAQRPLGLSILHVYQSVATQVGMPANQAFTIMFLRFSTTTGVALAISHTRNSASLYKTSLVGTEWGEWLAI